MSLPTSTTPNHSTQTRACCLCEGTDFEIINTKDRRGSSLVTVMCQHCGLISHRDIPTDEQLEQFYKSDYRLEYHGQRDPVPRRVMRAWKNGQRILRQLKPHVTRNARLLEIGAGLGCTVRNFQNAGYDIAGIDPSEDYTEFSTTQLGANMSKQSLADLDGTEPLDAILLVHVIEHLNAPHHAMLKLHRLLKPGGQLYIECPNLDAPVARRSQLFHYAHVYSFTPATLRMLAERCGFELVRQFGHKKQANLQMLFRRTEVRSFHIREHSSQRTLQRIRMSRLRYHLRPKYLIERVRKLTSYGIEHLFAERFVSRLIAECRNNRKVPVETQRFENPQPEPETAPLQRVA